MKKLITMTCFLFIISLSAQISDKEILDFTKANYLKLIGNMPERNLGMFGFETQIEIYQLTFSMVIPEYILVNNSPIKTNNYRVLALNEKGKPCGLFTIFYDGANLQVVDYGATVLANTIQTNLAGLGSAAHVSILRILISEFDYLFDDTVELYSGKFLKLYDSKFYSLTDLIKN